MELEFLLAIHRRKLEELKILKTFKYSGLIGIIVATISKGLIIPKIELNNVLMIIFIGFGIFVIFDEKIYSIVKDLENIENKIRKLRLP